MQQSWKWFIDGLRSNVSHTIQHCASLFGAKSSDWDIAHFLTFYKCKCNAITHVRWCEKIWNNFLCFILYYSKYQSRCLCYINHHCCKPKENFRLAVQSLHPSQKLKLAGCWRSLRCGKWIKSWMYVLLLFFEKAGSFVISAPW